jgi:sigma-E factor negative regulatory protein RseC
MIEETGVVVSVNGETAEVETRRQGACGSCSANGACGTSLLAQYLGRRPLLLRAHNLAGAGPGDRVVVGVPEEGLIWASVAAYLVPLLGLMAGGMAGAGLLPDWKEIASTLGGLSGLALGLIWMARFGRAHAQDPRYRAVVLRRVSGLSVGVPFPQVQGGGDRGGGSDLVA